MKQKYFLYARKSSESDEKQIQSIADQIDYWKHRAISLNIEIVRVFTEEKSALEPYKRAVFNEMITEIEKSGIDGILTWKLDRLSRNPVDTGTVQYILQKSKIRRIVTSDREYYPQNSGLIFSVETGMANQYSLDLSKNTKRGMQGKWERGWLPWPAPIGYINDRLEKTVLVDPERFALVRNMWDMMLTGQYSISKIVDRANNEWWFRTKSKKLSGGKGIYPSLLHTVFHNPFYMGSVRYNGAIKKGNHTPMVTPAEFEKVQNILSGNVLGERSKTREFAYTGCIRCGDCGCAVTAEYKTKTSIRTQKIHEYVYYHCTHRRDTRERQCPQRKNIEEKVLEGQITELLSSLSIDPAFTQWGKDVLRSRHTDEIETRNTIYENLNKTLEQETKKRDRILSLYIDGNITKEEFDAKKQETERKITILEEQRNTTEKGGKDWTNLIEQTLDFVSLARDQFENGDTETKKKIFKALGSNLLLKDQKLTLELNSWFLPLQKFSSSYRSRLWALEPIKNGISMRDTNAIEDVYIEWLPGLDSNQ